MDKKNHDQKFALKHLLKFNKIKDYFTLMLETDAIPGGIAEDMDDEAEVTKGKIIYLRELMK